MTKWHKFGLRRYILQGSALVLCAFSGISGSAAYANGKPTPPAPHKGPVLPGTHVPPRPIPPKPRIAIRIDAPAIAQSALAVHMLD